MEKNFKNLKENESCGHPGCLHHFFHPCENCGRIAGKYQECAGKEVNKMQNLLHIKGQILTELHEELGKCYNEKEYEGKNSYTSYLPDKLDKNVVLKILNKFLS